MADTVHALKDIVENGLPDLSTLKLLANQAARDPGSFFQTDYATISKALTRLVEGALNREEVDAKARTTVLTLLANLSKATAYASVIMEAVQALSEG